MAPGADDLVMSYYSVPKSNFGAWMGNFTTVCNDNALALGLEESDLTAIEAANTSFASSYANQETMRAAAKGATAQCNLNWSNVLDLVSQYNAIFQAIPGISPELLGQLGLTVPSGSGTVPIFTPSNLSALGTSNGVNSLKWKRNGNQSGTTYVIEAAYDGTNDWSIVDTSTRTKFDHMNQTPGRFVRYRIVAQRGTTKSAPSGTASVYYPGSNLSLESGGQIAA